MANLSNTILDAIEIMADKKVSAAGYDRTIQATIVSQMNAAKGEYVIRYQGNKFYAYSTDLEKTYRKGATVFVLVPENDFSKHKTILGVAGNVGEYSGTYIPEEYHYEEIAPDCIIDNESVNIKLCSYLGGRYNGEKMSHRLLLYKDVSYEVPHDITDLTVDPNICPFAEVLADLFVSESKESGFFLLRCNIQTDIAQEQWLYNTGEYGFEFIVEIEGEEEQKVIQFSSNSLYGNPLKYSVPQISTWFKRNPSITKLVAIYAYATNFTVYKGLSENPPYDIFIKDVELVPCKYIAEGIITTRTLFLLRPDGVKFSASLDKLRVIAVLKQQGEEVALPKEDVTYYWFVEQPDLIYKDTSSLEIKNLITLSGEGWKYIAQTDGSTPTYIFDRDDFKVDTTNIKCVMRYSPSTDNTKAATLDIRYSATTKLLRELDTGVYSTNDFELYESVVDATAIANGEIAEAITTAAWNKDDNNGYIFTSNGHTVAVYGKHTEDNDITTKWYVLDLSGNYEERESTLYEIDETLRGVVLATGADVTIGMNSKLYCCFYKNNEYICYKPYNIQYADELAIEDYNITVLNAGRTFIYNDAGIAPTETADGQTIILDPVTLRLTDNKSGELIEATDIAGAIDDLTNQNRSNITWYVVADDSDRLIELDGYELDEERNNRIMVVDGVECFYSYGPTVAYHLKQTYSISANSNLIGFIINYKKLILRGVAYFYCYKQGDPNVTLSGMYCDIVPYYENNNNVYTYFNIVYPDGINARPANWDNGTPATPALTMVLRYFDGNTWNTAENVTWTSLKNDNLQGYTLLIGAGNPTSITGFGLLNGSFTLPAAEIGGTDTSVNADYYATIPVGYCTNKRIRLVENSGFTYIKYGSSGYSPVYDSNRPFELLILDENGKDITSKCTYHWGEENRLYNLSTGKIEDTKLLKSAETDKVWLYKVNVNNSVYMNKYEPYGIYIYCTVEDEHGTLIGTIYLPIHIYKLTNDNSLIRGWDGHTLKLNSSPAYMLANTVAAGKLEREDLTFTGIMIGEVTSIVLDTAAQQESKTENGLMAYYKGERSAYISSKDGSATLGFEREGTINILPGRRSEIISGIYQEATYNNETEEYNEDGSGLKIGFGNDPYIEFGSLKFIVNKKGEITATGATIKGKFIAGNKKKYNRAEANDPAFPEESLFTVEQDGGFSLKHIRLLGSDTGTVYRESTDYNTTIYNDDGTSSTVTEGFIQPEQISGASYKKTVITDNEFKYGKYINDELIDGIEYRNGNLKLTGNFTATGAKITGSFYAGDRQKMQQLQNAVNNNDFSSITDGKYSASCFSVGNSGSFNLLSYTAKKNVEGKYLKTVKELITQDNGTVITLEVDKWVEVEGGARGYTEALVTSNGFSFGTYAKNLPIDEDGNREDVQIQGIRYRAGNLQITGKITATSGTIGGWSITENCIVSPGGGLRLWADGRISGYGNKETDVAQQATPDNDWLDMSGRMITWKQKGSGSRKWVKQPDNTYAYTEVADNVTTAAIQAKGGSLQLNGTLGISLNTASASGVALNVGSGGFSVDKAAEDANTKTVAATVTSDTGTSLVKITGIKETVRKIGGTNSGDDCNVESGIVASLSTYTAFVQGEKYNLCYYQKDSIEYQKDSKGNYVLDEHRQRIKIGSIHEEGWIVVVKDENDKKVFKKNPTASELNTYCKELIEDYPADYIARTLKDKWNKGENEPYTFEVKPYIPAKVSRVLGYAPDEVVLSQGTKKTGITLLMAHTTPVVISGTHYIYDLTEKYYKKLSNIIYDDANMNEDIELKWKIYTDEDKNVKALQAPDGHVTKFTGFENLQV